MRLLKLVMRHSAGLLVGAMIIGMIGGFAGSAVLAVVNENIRTLGHPEAGAALLFTALAVTSIVGKLAAKLMLVRASTTTVRDMRINLSRQIVNAPLQNVENNGASALMAALTQDIHRVAETLIELPEQCANFAIALACFGYLFWLSWPLALVYVGIFATGIMVYRTIARRAHPAMNQARELWDLLIEHYNGLIYGNKELKLHRDRRQAFIRDGLEPTAQDMREQSWRWNWILATASSHTQMIFFVLLGMALFLAPALTSVSDRVLSGFILMSLYMGGPIANLVGAAPKFKQADVALKKIRKLGLSLMQAEHRDVPAESPTGKGGARPRFSELELRGLCYRYPVKSADRAFGIGPLDLRIHRGELVYVIGGNGSGKSSFARVITGLYAPTDGELRCNGLSINDDNRDDYRQGFSVVFADYHLFRRLYGLVSDANHGQTTQLLEDLQLAEKVRVGTDGELSTVDLSQGQRKRLALLTAFLEDRDIYLFDEWAADQDPSFKRVFYEEILPALKLRGKTVIVISHDNQYFELAERVIRFADGHVVEDRVLRQNTPAFHAAAMAG